MRAKESSSDIADASEWGEALIARGVSNASKYTEELGKDENMLANSLEQNDSIVAHVNDSLSIIICL